MKSAIIYMLEVLACSGVLLAAYTILLERRVKFRWCRRYLLLSIPLAALIPLLRIPVWPGQVITATPVVTAPELNDWSAEVLPDAAEKAALLTPEAFGAGFYLLGVLLITGVMLGQVIRIRGLRRSAEQAHIGLYRLVRTQQQIASFSFWRTIYVWAQTPVEELAAIVAHESSHIAHRHSLERIFMEGLKALLWWNPFAWIAARRLTEAQEFEADYDVLNSGYDRADYMQTIFKQLFGYSPDIANGLRNSLTKKRFKMMTDKTTHRHGLLRLAATLPAVIGLLCAFSFTSRAAIVVTPDHETTQVNADKTPSKISLTVMDRDKTPIEGALIQIVGTKQGTVTDKKGRAEISASKGDKLAISYPDYATKTIDIDTGGEIVMIIPLLPETASADISAEPEASAAQPGQMKMADVRVMVNKDGEPLPGVTIVVAGGTRGTVTDAQGTAQIKVPANTTLELSYIDCEKQTIEVGDEADQVFIRTLGSGKPQAKTVKGAGDPLIIVDGVEVSSLDEIDTSKVESMSILKDASSVALYGEKGRNGVVVITLKGKGKTLSDTKQQASGKSEEPIGDEPFLISETMPEFPIPSDSLSAKYGDLNAFRAWVQQQVKYPLEALKNNIQGRVVLSFVIEKDGSVSNITPLQFPDESLWQEARRVIAASPKWKPGLQHGEAVRVKYTLPVDFRATSSSNPAAADAKAADPQAPLLVAETMPRFNDGDLNTFRTWVMQRVRYPEEALKNNIYGRVIVSFVVEKDGSIGQISEIESPGKSLTDEVRRVIAASPKWTPGQQRGETVRVKYTLPVDFSVSTQDGVVQGKKEYRPGSNAADEIVVVGYGTQKKE